MGIWYIQTWMVSKGKIKEHDEVQKKWYSYAITKIKKQPRSFNKLFGPVGGRVFIMEFDSFADYENFFETMFKDEENVKFQTEWLSYIDPGSWKGFFWRERALE